MVPIDDLVIWRSTMGFIDSRVDLSYFSYCCLSYCFVDVDTPFWVGVFTLRNSFWVLKKILETGSFNSSFFFACLMTGLLFVFSWLNSESLLDLMVTPTAALALAMLSKSPLRLWFWRGEYELSNFILCCFIWLIPIISHFTFFSLTFGSSVFNAFIPAGLLILLEFSLNSYSSNLFSIISLLCFCEIFIETLETIDLTICRERGLLDDYGLLRAPAKLTSAYKDLGDRSSLTILIISGESCRLLVVSDLRLLLSSLSIDSVDGLSKLIFSAFFILYWALYGLFLPRYWDFVDMGTIGETEWLRAVLWSSSQKTLSLEGRGDGCLTGWGSLNILDFLIVLGMNP